MDLVLALVTIPGKKETLLLKVLVSVTYSLKAAGIKMPLLMAKKDIFIPIAPL